MMNRKRTDSVRTISKLKMVLFWKEEAMNKSSALLTLIPVAFVVVVIVYEKLRQNKIRNEYDEMQLEIRGRGAWYGFYAGIFYWAACFVAETVFEVRFLTASNAVFLGIMISGSVIAGYSILHDSYYGMNRSGSRNLAFLIIIAAIEAACLIFLVRLIREGLFSDLKRPCSDERLIVLLCIPMFTTILVTTLIRRLRPEEEDI